MLSWHSQRQCATASSTAEAEIVSLSRFCRDLLLPTEIRMDAIEGSEMAVRVYEDNTATIQVVRDGTSSALLFVRKHHRISIGVLSDVFSHARRSPHHIETDHQRADVFTKVMDAAKLKTARGQLGLVDKGEAPGTDFCFVKTSSQESALLSTILEFG